MTATRRDPSGRDAGRWRASRRRPPTRPAGVRVALAGECDLAVRDELTATLLGRRRPRPGRGRRPRRARLPRLQRRARPGHRPPRGPRARARQLFVVNPSGPVATVLDLTGVGALLSPPARQRPAGDARRDRPPTARCRELSYDEPGDLAGGARVRPGRAPATSACPRRGPTCSRLAVSELATNTLQHTAGGGRVRLWAEAGRLLCDVDRPGPAAPARPGHAGRRRGTRPRAGHRRADLRRGRHRRRGRRHPRTADCSGSEQARPLDQASTRTASVQVSSSGLGRLSAAARRVSVRSSTSAEAAASDLAHLGPAASGRPDAPFDQPVGVEQQQVAGGSRGVSTG